jgi:LmbE family N-acetylglucosaminyl deacetylase
MIRSIGKSPARVLAVSAHPADAELQAGATLARWANEGSLVHHVVCTDGSKGTWDPTTQAAELRETRQQEQRAANLALGAQGDVTFLDYVDGELVDTMDARRRLTAVIRQVKPDLVLTHDPWHRYRLHPDHAAAGFLTVNAIVAARDPLFFPDLEIAPHRPAALWLYETDTPNHVEPTTVEWISVQLGALLAHQSQLKSTMNIDDPNDEIGIERFRRSLEEARTSDNGTLGEEFHIITDL